MTRIQETWEQVRRQHGEMTHILDTLQTGGISGSSAVLPSEISIATTQLEEVEMTKSRH